MTPFSAEDLIFHAVRNAQYHTTRRRTLERWDRYATTITILLGTAIVAEASVKIGLDVVWLGIATSTAGVIQLVYDFSGRARAHELLQRRYYDLIAAMRRKPTPTDADIAEWNGILAQIYGDEPPVNPADDAAAYNAAGNALGMDAEEALIIPWWIHPLAALGLADGYHFETRKERDDRRAKARQ